MCSLQINHCHCHLKALNIITSVVPMIPGESLPIITSVVPIIHGESLPPCRGLWGTLHTGDDIDCNT